MCLLEAPALNMFLIISFFWAYSVQTTCLNQRVSSKGLEHLYSKECWLFSFLFKAYHYLAQTEPLMYT